jgi:putative tryptophan/tyrosine transport system substrate-binding protein
MRRREFIRLFTSTVVAWPLVARAQQERKVATVGIMWHGGSVAEEAIFLTQIQQGLKDLGYVEGRNVTLVNTFAGEQYERFNSNAAELVRRKVDVIVAVTLSAAIAAKRATNTIPIVFIVVPDPVATKLVSSLAHPGGNITGLSTLAADLLAKRLALFKEIVDALSGIALMVNPANPITTEGNIKQVRIAAERLGMTVQVIEAAQPDQIERAFSSIQGGINGVMILDDSLFFNERKQIAAFALQRMLPTAVFTSPMVEDGALMTYAASPLTIFRRSAAYIDKILKGTKPDQLPVELPTEFEFVINLKTAKAIGLSISPTILSRADKVID